MRIFFYIFFLLTLMGCSNEGGTPTPETSPVENRPLKLLGYEPLDLETLVKNRDGKFLSTGISNSRLIYRLALEGHCDISIGFASYASGIPYKHLNAAKSWLSTEDAVETVYVVNWGFEGETTLCASVPNAAQRKSIIRSLNKAVNKQGEPERGTYSQAADVTTLSTLIGEADILQSPKFQYIIDKDRWPIEESYCHMKVHIADSFAPLNTKLTKFMREWLIKREDVTHIHGIEREYYQGTSYGYLCASGPPTQDAMLELMRDFKKAILIEFPNTKRFPTTYIRNPPQKGEDYDMRWTCRLLKKEMRDEYGCKY